RVQTVVDYAQPSPATIPASPRLLRALGDQTEACTAKLDFRSLVPWAALQRRAVVLGLASLLGLAVFLLSPGLRPAASRILLFPGHYTAVDVQPGDVTLKAGDELKVNVTLSGRPVSSAHWLYKGENRREWTAVSLAHDRASGQPGEGLIGNLSAGLEDCQ